MNQPSIDWKIVIICYAALGWHCVALAQKESRFKIIFYNVENFFDTIDSKKFKDKDFTPTGKFEWNTQRYQTKISNLSKVVNAITDSTPLLFLGVCEIENKQVIKDWLKSPLMARHHLHAVHFDSMDPRGIDVALLFNKKFFKPTYKENIPVQFDFDPQYQARSILYVKGKFGKEYLHIFVNHWSSRKGGAEKSEPRRIRTAEILRKKIDEIYSKYYNSKIILMGDFNDPPHAPSIAEKLNVKQSLLALKEKDLFNLMSEPAQRGQYSFDYEGEQDMLDQIIVSENMVSSNCRICIDKNKGEVFQPKWLMYKSSKFGYTPFRTFEGTKYTGGFSDHLPVYCDLIVK
jgi:predicted extracellular nuclease